MENSYWEVPTFKSVQKCFAIRPSKQRVCHTMDLPFTLKVYFKAKKIYGHSNISPCKNNNLPKKSS